MDAEKIATAIERCVADATRSERPFRTVNEFLAELKRQGWEEADRALVQAHVLEAIRRRREKNGGRL